MLIDDTKLAELQAENQKLRNQLDAINKANAEGRLIILPVKPSGATVYQLRNKGHALGEGVQPRQIACARVWSATEWSLQHNGMHNCTSEEFGETWFLTEEEANAVLLM